MDLFTLNALATELNENLYGAKIDKIVQPETDEIRLYLRRKNRNFVLVISANAKVPRIHLTSTKKANPANAPAFCMLLRKHLAVGAVEKVSVVNCDRIIKIDFICKSELKDFLRYAIIVELMGRYSNVVFLDGDGKILDAVKKTSLDDERHAVFKGVKYLPPQLPKNSVFSENFKECLSKVDFKSFPSVTDALISNFSGFTKASWALCLSLAKIDPAAHELSADGSYYIVAGIEAGIYADELIIPDEYNGLPVYEIANGAFEGNTDIVSVQMGAGLHGIGERAFAGCANLKTVNIPEEVADIGGEAFSGCLSLALVEYQAADAGSSDTNIFSGAGNGGDGITLYIAESVLSLPANLFFVIGVNSLHPNLTAIEIAENSRLEEIGEGAFKECLKLKEVSLPASVKKICAEAFYGCSALVKAVVPSAADIDESTFMEVHKNFAIEEY